MRLIGEDEARALADPIAAASAVADALNEAANGATAMQTRKRIVAGAVKLSTMAAILPGAGLAGAKVYTTIGGRFCFLVVLFDANSGKPLACIEANALTEIRTAAVTETVAAAFVRAAPSRLAVFGAGVQARSHVRALVRRFGLQEVSVVSRSDATAFCAEMGEATGVPIKQTGADAALEGADIVVTATRSSEPVLDAERLEENAFVAAVGATLPWARELPGSAYSRAGRVLVEDLAQSFSESGDLILAEAEGCLDRKRVETLSDALKRPGPSANGAVIFKSVGIALADVAVAGAIWRAVKAREQGAASADMTF